jgi:hypothetical protein
LLDGRCLQGEPNSGKLPAAPRCCHTWQWLVATSSAKEMQHHHHHQLPNGSTIVKTFRCPDDMVLF